MTIQTPPNQIKIQNFNKMCIDTQIPLFFVYVHTQGGVRKRINITHHRYIKKIVLPMSSKNLGTPSSGKARSSKALSDSLAYNHKCLSRETIDKRAQVLNSGETEGYLFGGTIKKPEFPRYVMKKYTSELRNRHRISPAALATQAELTLLAFRALPILEL